MDYVIKNVIKFYLKIAPKKLNKILSRILKFNCGTKTPIKKVHDESRIVNNN